MKINNLSIFYIMTDNSQNFDSLQEKNQQVLNNISQLQTQEKQLYDSLDNAALSSDQKQQIINKINEISQMRINMYSNMKDMYSFYQKNVAASNSLIGQEVSAIDILETELNKSKLRMNLIQDEKNNKLRLVEINTYYGKQYNAHSKLMKTIIFTCIPVIILSVLANKGILPQNLYAFLTGIIIIIGVVFIGLELIDMSNRDNMNWDEYNWYFNNNNILIYTMMKSFDDRENIPIVPKIYNPRKSWLFTKNNHIENEDNIIIEEVKKSNNIFSRIYNCMFCISV